MARLIFVEDNSELATILVLTATDLGHVAVHVTTGSAAHAALDQNTFDLAVVDLLLPDMRGADLLLRLKEKGIPSIAVSGIYRGERFSREATTLQGAKAYFEKPFDIAKLFETIHQVVGKPADVETIQSEGEDVESEEEYQVRRSQHETEPGRPALPTAPVRRDPDESYRVSSPFQSSAARVSPPMVSDDFELLESWDTEAAPDPRTVADWAWQGDLQTHSLPRLLGAYHAAGVMGQLELRHDSVVKVISFAQGSPCAATSNVESEGVGNIAVQLGLLTEGSLESIGGSGTPFIGKKLLAAKLLSEAQLKEVLAERLKMIVKGAFSWASGLFRYAPGRSLASTEDAPVHLPVASLIWEGMQDLETLETLRQRMPRARTLFPVSTPDFSLHHLPLSATQARLLVSTDGTKTVGDLLQLSDLQESDLLSALNAFEVLGLVEERIAPRRSNRVIFGL